MPDIRCIPRNNCYCKVYTADAKLGFDDNASFRQKPIFDMEDTTESEPREVEAAKHNLNYVQVSMFTWVVDPDPDIMLVCESGSRNMKKKIKKKSTFFFKYRYRYLMFVI
jgi:hypothetical protein